MKREVIPLIGFVFVVVVALSVLAGYRFGVMSVGRDTLRDTVTYVDTVCYYRPVARDSVVVRYVSRRLAVAAEAGEAAKDFKVIKDIKVGDAADSGYNADSGYSVDSDSVDVAVPITQKRYSGADYCAWVSGYEASLDSLFVYPRTTVIRERLTKPPDRWHVGVVGGWGYGFGSRHGDAFVGVGVMYSLWGF